MSLLLLFPATAGAQHTQPVDDTFAATDAAARAVAARSADTATVTDALAKAASRTLADTFSGIDSFAGQWDAARALGDTAGVTDAVATAHSGPVAYQVPIDDAAQATDLISKHLAAVRPPRPGWEP